MQLQVHTAKASEGASVLVVGAVREVFAGFGSADVFSIFLRAASFSGA